MNQKPTILIIDDENQIRNLLTKLLSDQYHCLTAASAEEALTVLQTTEFDLVISDINMGGITGLDLVPLVHKEAPDTVVLMISAQQTIETAISAMRAGAFDYVMKPFDLDHVDAALGRALNHRKLLKDKRRYENELQDLVRQGTAEVERLAYYDPLTNLPNRVLFEDRLTQAMAIAQRHQQMLATVFVGLDQFKRIKDTLGHAAGDQLLAEAAGRLQGRLREGETLARFDSDEFVLLLPQVNATGDLVEISRSLREALKESFYIGGQQLYVTASFGISLFPFDGVDSDALLKNAAAALYRCRNEGGNDYQFYKPDMNDRAINHLSLENSLRQAVENEDFEVFYQPQLDLETRQVVGVEALVRWQHPELGYVSPEEFIPVAEDTGLIVPLGAWVLRTACAQVRSWQQEGYANLRLAVNVSPRQFQQENLMESIVQTLSDTGLDGNCLEIELTESSIMQNAESAAKTFRGLKERGVKIAIDDFGTGHSSLSYLSHLPLNVLKVDRSFIHNATTNPDDAALVMAIITLAHNLRLKVIAEGVETEEHARFLRLLRCDEGQGYLFGKAMPAGIFRSWLAQSSVGEAHGAGAAT